MFRFSIPLLILGLLLYPALSIAGVEEIGTIIEIDGKNRLVRIEEKGGSKSLHQIGKDVRIYSEKTKSGKKESKAITFEDLKIGDKILLVTKLEEDKKKGGLVGTLSSVTRLE